MDWLIGEERNRWGRGRGARLPVTVAGMAARLAPAAAVF